MRTQNKCKICKCFTCWGGDGKNVTGTVKVVKKNNNFKKTLGYLYFLCYEMEVNVCFSNLCVKANSKRICEEISFPSFLRVMLMSAFLLRFKANKLLSGKKCMATPIFL